MIRPENLTDGQEVYIPGRRYYGVRPGILVIKTIGVRDVSFTYGGQTQRMTRVGFVRTFHPQEVTPEHRKAVETAEASRLIETAAYQITREIHNAAEDRPAHLSEALIKAAIAWVDWKSGQPDHPGLAE